MPETISEKTNKIQRTTDYDKFSFIAANRQPNRGHIERLKRAFEEYGNLTKVQPLLVNEHFQIVDGQHRFVAAQELGQPIYYMQQPGLGVREARSMNILHAGWTIDDYAESYARQGDRNYQKYLKLKEAYGFNNSITLSYINGARRREGIFAKFREGDLVISDEDEATAVARLDKLSQAVAVAPLMEYRPLALALLVIMRSESYNHAKMVRKLQTYGDRLKKIEDVGDCARQLEEIYNRNTNASAQVRLY